MLPESAVMKMPHIRFSKYFDYAAESRPRCVLSNSRLINRQFQNDRPQQDSALPEERGIDEQRVARGAYPVTRVRVPEDMQPGLTRNG